MRNRFDRHRRRGSLDMREGEMEKVSLREIKTNCFQRYRACLSRLTLASISLGQSRPRASHSNSTGKRFQVVKDKIKDLR